VEETVEHGALVAVMAYLAIIMVLLGEQLSLVIHV
jgi:hypothetical protein